MAYPRAVILRHAVGMLGQDDELHTDDSLRGLTAAWLPGDHGLTILVGGGNDDKGKPMEPALSVFVHSLSAPRLLALVNDLTRPFPTVGPRKHSGETTPWEDSPPPPSWVGPYDPRTDPFDVATDASLWHGRVRCYVLSQGPQFYWPMATGDERDADDGDPERLAGIQGAIEAYVVSDEDRHRGRLGDRTCTLHFNVAGVVRVHITPEEASELVTVLRHRPEWAEG